MVPSLCISWVLENRRLFHHLCWSAEEKNSLFIKTKCSMPCTEKATRLFQTASIMSPRHNSWYIMQDCRHYFQLQCRFLLGNKGYGGHLGLCHIVWGKKHIKVRSKAGIYCTVKESCFLLFIFIFSWILTHLTFFSIFFRKWFRFRVNIWKLRNKLLTFRWNK